MFLNTSFPPPVNCPMLQSPIRCYDVLRRTSFVSCERDGLTCATGEEAVYLVGGFVWFFLFFASTNQMNVTNRINQRD